MTHPDPDTPDMTGLDALFSDAAKGPDLAPSEAFMTQMMESALAHQPVPVAIAVPWWRQALSVLGGWQGMGGLVAATCAGFWIGVNPPDTMPSSFDSLLNIEAVYSNSEDTADLLGFGWVLEEE
ncbi:MAG: hypothetical protein ACI9PY_002790 [Ascidiaceihabitans sp.]|jgi:hypothetical protein